MIQKNEIFINYKKNLIKEQIEKLNKNSVLIENFIDFCKEKGITLSKNNFQYFPPIGIIASFPNLINLLNLEIKKDKEGLVSFEKLNKEFKIKHFVNGYFFSEKYMAMVHPYFRRSYNLNNNFSPKFIEKYWAYDKGNKKYIALDFDRVRINVDDRIYIEEDTWYGAIFTKNILDIQDGIVKLTPPLDLNTDIKKVFFANSYSLNIKWYSKDGIKVFQAEEFKESDCKINNNGNAYYPAKYIHAEFDIKTQTFRHFDGAIHLYTKNEYLQKRDTCFNRNKNGVSFKGISQKLFKINGKIEVDDWAKLTSHFLTGNPLIVEYFEGKLPVSIIEIVQKSRNSGKNSLERED